MLAVVKADAYGHGAVAVAETLVEEGAEALAVAYLPEALELRQSGIRGPILVLFGAEPSGVRAFFDDHLIPVVWSMEQARAFSSEARRRGSRLPIHIKVDTGMGRVGLQPEDAITRIGEIAALPGIEVEGLLSHFSDADLAEPAIADRQVEVFRKIIASLAARSIRPRACHMANSAAVIRYPAAHFDMVRPGLMLYGYNPIADFKGPELRPVLSLTTQVLAVKTVPAGTPISYGRTWKTPRKSRIATIGIGYADGYSRRFSNQGEVLLRGRRAPVVGRVCMDLTMIDVTEIADVGPGDPVTLIGRDGDRECWADDLARKIDTIPYEILTSLGKRVRRVTV